MVRVGRKDRQNSRPRLALDPQSRFVPAPVRHSSPRPKGSRYRLSCDIYQHDRPSKSCELNGREAHLKRTQPMEVGLAGMNRFAGRSSVPQL